eukprot:TRINITY_DN87977_c3_g1_i1.p1 TRINITY_DN87977_c3_g1~~TRINITY_DN87977_c3_g1_i1.p1  ORF type:complete len:1021 (-),score=134.76 TRINITY_DN87977_c3_g1_i1:716-3778(-)
MSGSMRGLISFINKIKSCSNDLEEEKRVEQELAKVRAKLANKGLSGYRRKKCLWKLVYITMIGYSVDLGHVEASFLINSDKFSEKITGYISTSVLFNEESSARLDVVINSIKGDLLSGTMEVKAMVLSALANSPFKVFVDKLTPLISQMAFTGGYGNNVLQKKALVCLSAFLKKDPNIYQEKWGSNIKGLLMDTNTGIVLAATNFLGTCMRIKGVSEFVPLVDTIIEVLKKLVEQSSAYSYEYSYYGTLCPWLQVKLLQLLQVFPYPSRTDSGKIIQTALSQIITKVEVGSNINKNNADHSILFEAINLTLHYKQSVVSSLRRDVLTILNKYIGVREPNVRYLALESMAKMQGSPETSSIILSQKNIILISLRDPDPSIRKRALDVLFALCNKDLAPEIVNDLLDYLAEKDIQLKEELVLKIALLAEKFGENIYWYIDVIIRMLQLAGYYVSNDVWYRVAQVLTGFEGTDVGNDTQKYAAAKLLATLNTAHAYEPLVKLGAYVLGEYGDLIAENGKALLKQYEVLLRHYNACTSEGKCMILNAFAKMAAKSPSIKEQVVRLLEGCASQWDLDVQQRAIEYLSIMKSEQFESLKDEVLDKIPAFPEDFLYNNVILRSLHKLQRIKHKDEEIEEVKEEDKVQPEAKPETVTKPQKAEVPAPSTKQLLDIDMDLAGKEKPANDLGTIFNVFSAPVAGNVFAESEPAIKSHPIYSKYRSRFSKELCIDPDKVSEPPMPLSNATYFRKLISGSIKEGIIYEDDLVTIKVKSEYNSFLGRCLVQCASKKGNIESISPECIQQRGFDTQCSKVKYSGNTGMFMIQIMLNAPIATPPIIRVDYKVGTMLRKAELGLPAILTKFIEAQECTLEAAARLWGELEKHNASIDAITKNPAPAHFTHIQVLMKLAQLLNECFGLYVVPPADENSFTSLYAVGKLQIKNPEQINFPTSASEVKPAKIIPVMIEVEFYPDISMGEFRFSVRSENKDVSEVILALFKLFIKPQQAIILQTIYKRLPVYSNQQQVSH